MRRTVTAPTILQIRSTHFRDDTGASPTGSRWQSSAHGHD